MPVVIQIGNASPSGIYGIVKSTYDLYQMDRLSWNEVEHGKTPPNTLVADGAPDAQRIFERTKILEHTELTENLQHWILRCNLEVVKGRPYTKEQYFQWFNDTDTIGKAYEVAWFINELSSALRANRYSVNFYGMDNGANFLTGQRLDEQLPKWIKILTGWACLKMILEVDNITPKKRDINWAGTSYAFECIDASGEVWVYSPLTHPHLFDKPMVTAREVGFNSGGAYIIRDNLHIPFGQLDDKLIFPIMMPTDSVAWIPVNLIKFVNQYQPKVWIR